jgi:hypothetical protein
MATHAEVSYVVEEDDGCGGVWIDGFAEQCTDDDLGSAGFADDTAAEVIEFALQALDTSWQISCSEIRSTGNDDARRFSLRVGVDYLNPSV